jgi:hypothetical protein
MRRKRAIGRLGSPQIRPVRSDPRQELGRFPGYALGRPRHFNSRRVPVSAVAAVEAAAGPREEASGSNDL